MKRIGIAILSWCWALTLIFTFIVVIRLFVMSL